MLQIYPKLITDALATVRYPGTGKNLVEANMIEDDLRIDGMNVSFSIIFEKSTDPFMKSVVKAAEAAIHTYVDKDVNVTVKTKTIQAARPEPGKMLPQVKNVIAVSSGKGGVGKSTVAANLAVALAQAGYKVGLLDADIFGPSMPKMFHMENENIFAEMKDGRQVLIPAMKYGVKLLSIGFFVNPETATLWRGGMASNALKQLIADCDWGELDYFVLDTPPGTSDIHLTLLQNLAITGAVIVSTPQQVALADARKGIDMYRNEKVNVPILGLVETWHGSLRKSCRKTNTTSSARAVSNSSLRKCKCRFWGKSPSFRVSAKAATKANRQRFIATPSPDWPSALWLKQWSGKRNAATANNHQRTSLK